MKQNLILVLGGYGGNNVGDDAQLEGALNDLYNTIPEGVQVVLTPNLEQTVLRHSPQSVAYAPRVSFFDFDEDPHRYIEFWKDSNKKWMLERLDFVISNVEKKYNGECHKLTAKQEQLVDLIERARLVYYAGGGFIMGPTASRLWDAALVCQIAKIYNTSVVMSGQNMGVWLNCINEDLAKISFPSIKMIGTRDGTFSRQALVDIGVDSEKIITTHDDALYIKNTEPKVRDYILRRIGLNKGSSYISLSFHKTDGILEIVKTIRELSKLPIVIIPTCPPDKGPQLSIYNELKKLKVDNVYIVMKLHSHSEIKGIIENAYLCVSSRHHPVIFALSGNVPPISLNYSKYFSEKNYGALSLCDVGQLSIDVEGNNDYLNSFRKVLKAAIKQRKKLSNVIEQSHIKIKNNKQIYLDELRNIWDSSL